MTSAEPILIIHDGGLPALVACLMVPDFSDVIAWVPPAGSSLRGVGADHIAQSAFVRQQADLLGFGRVLTPAGPGETDADAGAHRVFEQPRTLLRAAADATALGCRRWVWPIVAGDRAQDLLEFSERAALINRLLWLAEAARTTDPGAAPSPPRLETPFIDLTPAQVADAARDLDAPLAACWWTEEMPV